MTDLTEDQIRILDAIHLAEAINANDQTRANNILKLWTGQHDQLAVALAQLLAAMLRSNHTPTDFLAGYRTRLLKAEP